MAARILVMEESMMGETYGNHILDGSGTLRAEHDKPHGNAGSLSGHGIIHVQVTLQLLINVGACRTHSGEAESQASPMPVLLEKRECTVIQAAVHEREGEGGEGGGGRGRVCEYE